MQVQNSKEGSGEEEVVDGNRADKKRKEVRVSSHISLRRSCSRLIEHYWALV